MMGMRQQLASRPADTRRGLNPAKEGCPESSDDWRVLAMDDGRDIRKVKLTYFCGFDCTYLLKMSDGGSSIAVYVYSNVYKVTRGISELFVYCLTFGRVENMSNIFIL
jgi:hypothetical protein